MLLSDLQFPHLKMLPRGRCEPTREWTLDERRKYLGQMVSRYRVADRAGRGVLLTEMEVVTGLHRKHLLRLYGAGRVDSPPTREAAGAGVWSGSR